MANVTLAAYVQAPPGDAYAAQCEAEAEAMVEHRTAGHTVPAAIIERAKLEVGAELFHRRQSRNGIAGLDGMDIAPMRIARDPMKAAYDILRPYLGPAIA